MDLFTGRTPVWYWSTAGRIHTWRVCTWEWNFTSKSNQTPKDSWFILYILIYYRRCTVADYVSEFRSQNFVPNLKKNLNPTVKDTFFCVHHFIGKRDIWEYSQGSVDNLPAQSSSSRATKSEARQWWPCLQTFTIHD